MRVLGNRKGKDKVAQIRTGLLTGPQVFIHLILLPLQALQSGRVMLFPWIAVLMACGVAVWFAVLMVKRLYAVPAAALATILIIVPGMPPDAMNAWAL